MSRRSSNTHPPYRLHKSTGHALVVIDGQTHWLGKYDTPESRQRYDRVVGEWLARGRKNLGDEKVIARYERARERVIEAAAEVDSSDAERPVGELRGQRVMLLTLAHVADWHTGVFLPSHVSSLSR